MEEVEYVFDFYPSSSGVRWIVEGIGAKAVEKLEEILGKATGYGDGAGPVELPHEISLDPIAALWVLP
jgi:hypothetical protein